MDDDVWLGHVLVVPGMHLVQSGKERFQLWRCEAVLAGFGHFVVRWRL